MAMSEKLEKLFNEQIKHEYDSRNVYFGMEAWLRDNDWDGFGHWFMIQADEEMKHCRFFMDYMAFTGHKWEMMALEAQTNEYESVLDVFEKGLEHEKFITSKIKEMYDQAFEDRDYHAMKFLDWYIQEQAEEENNFATWIARIKRTEGGGMTILDQEAGTRVDAPVTDRPVEAL